MYFEQVTFFRPDEIRRERTSLAAETYNRCRLLLGRSPTNCQFVPIRTMQYQGVITNDEIIFVDSQGYAVRDGQGGRLIVLAWQIVNDARHSLTAPISIDAVHYHETTLDFRRRLLGEFDKAMQQMLNRQLEADGTPQSLKVIAIGGQG
ncbi:MAG: hypothetical protein PVG22_02835 [Chromatiales bacterium]|jgi:hypothetical protein